MLPDAATYLSYLAAIALLTITPGPDMMFVIANAGRWGTRAGIVAALGITVGEALHMTVAALGLASVFAANPVLYQVIRYAGAAYLLYLGVQVLRHRSRASEESAADHSSPRAAFTRGMVTNVLNPKMALFSLAFLPQFIDPAQGAVTGQLLVLGATFVLLQFIVDVGLSVAAGQLGDRFLRRPAVARGVNTVTGAVFIGLGVRLAAFG
ncbi:LysE family translocator [Stackebrandtia nassauensis]|uniref:Lysine exporter protein (LYSE/YGGA) n=1 Tax=Stackebrandtia nassauensis (strain DSM 44728 / CIP 108903 / NRRL B-16338 / NBRC 102104 / LLR-40K-21) TaxID=446470 RepID=D3Q325_STANL|nr:LysE family translocator [Stackebrandtia nassauensis]ADD39995.1 Lysine exporter protein (LYSE/YGGA) [Stackebrandtia nassauensis DSM 44728]